MKILLTILCVAGIMAIAHPAPQATAVRVPAFTAYIEPNPEGVTVSEAVGVTGWSDKNQTVSWFGFITKPGKLEVALSLRLPAEKTAQLQCTVNKKTFVAQVRGAANGEPVSVNVGAVDISQPGFVRFTLKGVARSGATFGDLDALVLSGPASEGAHFNLKERRNAASVHLGYPVAKDVPITAFYNEVTVQTDPIWSYYMACGFARGYFGIQVNSETERRIIFSIWDSGNEAVDRSKVGAENRVTLLAKGEGVYASDFGNEGTGGHSHLKYSWQTKKTQRFLVTAKPEGSTTIYSGYFYFPEKKQWGLISRFRAPKDGGYLRGLYSFNENFGGANGQLRRLAEFGNQWVRLSDGTWQELTTARFTHDPTGKEDRKDYGAGLKEGRFYLSNGGFVGDSVKYGDTFQRPGTQKPPADIPTEILEGR